jgi:ubiquinone/menaquinone biosynthesis C-methylase UbiE
VAKNVSEDDCVQRHEVYPDLEKDLSSDFQRRRVQSAADRVRPGDWVLDVGCNSGYFKRFCPQAAGVTGVDVNPDLVKIARTRLDHAEVARGEALPFTDHAFDLVNISEVLEHVHDPEQLIREAARVTKRSIVGDTPHESGTWGAHRVESHAWHVMCFTEATLRELLERYGRIVHFGTVDIGNESQCYIFEIEVGHVGE